MYCVECKIFVEIHVNEHMLYIKCKQDWGIGSPTNKGTPIYKRYTSSLSDKAHFYDKNILCLPIRSDPTLDVKM